MGQEEIAVNGRRRVLPTWRQPKREGKILNDLPYRSRLIPRKQMTARKKKARSQKAGTGPATTGENFEMAGHKRIAAGVAALCRYLRSGYLAV